VSYFWLSFAMSGGWPFICACIVRADSHEAAVDRAIALNLHPGDCSAEVTELENKQLSHEQRVFIRKYFERRLTRAEVEESDCAFDERFP